MVRVHACHHEADDVFRVQELFGPGRSCDSRCREAHAEEARGQRLVGDEASHRELPWLPDMESASTALQEIRFELFSIPHQNQLLHQVGQLLHDVRGDVPQQCRSSFGFGGADLVNGCQVAGFLPRLTNSISVPSDHIDMTWQGNWLLLLLILITFGLHPFVWSSPHSAQHFHLCEKVERVRSAPNRALQCYAFHGQRAAARYVEPTMIN